MLGWLRSWREQGWTQIDAATYADAWQRFGGSVATHPQVIERLAALANIPVRYLGWIEQGSSFLVLCLWACLGRFGLGLLLPALSTGSMDVLSPEELSQGAGAITFVRQLGGAFGINLLTYFLEWRHLAEGTGTAADAEAFRQTFWLVALLFLLAAVPALGVRRRQFPDPHP